MSALTEFLDENFSVKGRDNNYYLKGKYRTFGWKFSKIFGLSKNLAAFLTQNGIKAGDRIIIKSPNSPQWVAAFTACIKMGFIIVPVDYKSDFNFEQKIISKVKPEFILYSRENETFNIISNLINNSGTADINKSTSINKSFDNQKIGILLLEDLETTVKDYDFKDDTYERSSRIEDNNLAEIVFTSGSTSAPKGVILTHKNISSNLKAASPLIEKWKFIFNLMINPKLLSLVPLSHMYGQVIGIFIPLMIGSSVVFFNTINPEEILRAVKEEKIWILGALPKLVSIIKNHIAKKYNLNSEAFKSKYRKLRNVRWWIRLILFSGLRIKIGWRLVAVISGGAAIDYETEDFFRCLAYSVFQGYGLTETAPLITLTDPAKNREGSVGSFLSGQEIKIIDGELYVKGENVSSGYFEPEHDYSEAFKNGWFKTGDIAEVDKNGNVFIKGRIDDLIVRPDGLNIYPYDIENAVKSASARVRDCAVFGIEKEVHAVLLMDFKNYPDTGENEINEIIKDANNRLNQYQKIDSFSMWHEPDFPRTSTLKPKKSEIKRIIIESLKVKEEFLPHRGQEIKGREFTENDKADLYNIIGSFYKISKDNIKDEAKLQDDLGLDSLDIVELSSALEEKFGIDTGTLSITKDTNLKELENLITNPPEEIYKVPFFNFPYSIFFVILRTISQFFMFPFISILYRRQYEGRGNLYGIKQPSVFASNHLSLIDTFVILFSLPLKIRLRLTTVMSIEHHFLNYFNVTGNILRRIFEAAGFYLFVCLFLNVIPLSRTRGFKQSLENIGSLIDRGWNVLIFPEGAITIDGNIKEFEPGIGVIAKDMKVLVIPVRIDGLYDILHNGILPIGHLPKVPVVKVKYGKQVEMFEGSYQEIANNLREMVLRL
ncbi:MAG: AMP-binding protein [Actinobacteria bacterium]|nr:AMP-binding protein [Actinomycetota bacterium]